MALDPRSWTIRLLSRILAPGQGEVRALEQALHLEGVFRFVALFAATIIMPSMLLAYFGLTSIRGEELAVMAEVSRQADLAAEGFWGQVDRDLSGFEKAVFNRLEAGRSPIDSQRELHRHLLVVLRFDQDRNLVAPFVSNQHPHRPQLGLLFDPAYRAASEAERDDKNPQQVVGLYSRAEARAKDAAQQGRIRLDRARALVKAGRTRDALALLERVQSSYGEVRDPWGFRLADLARLEAGEILLGTDEEKGKATLGKLLDDLLAESWTVNEGGEAAIARRALALLEPHRDRGWVAQVRGRLAEQSAALYWAGELLPEFERLAPTDQQLQVATGQIAWLAGNQGLWAITRWRDDQYAFALDKEAVVSELKADAHGSVHHESPVVAYLLSPSEEPPDDALARRSLAPWLTGWSLVVAPRDPQALELDQARKRTKRVGIVGFAVAILGVGVVLIVRLVGRELDVASMKADFAANVSHELRSPITQIRLKGESLMLGLADTEEELVAAYEAIVRESERLSRLVDNVLDFAAIERGSRSYRLREGDLTESVRRALDGVSSSMELYKMTVDVQLPGDLPPVLHDADAVGQCVVNLVSNAAKYSGDSDWIGVTARRTTTGVEIAVSDRGIGIAAHDLRKIFDPFYRSHHSQARRQKGTGIGLAITQHIMEAHGGKVHAQSRPGAGSTFTLVFPIKDSS